MKTETEIKEQNDSFDFIRALLKMFEKTLNIIIASLEKNEHTIELNANVFKSHFTIMNELATDLGKTLNLTYEIQDEYKDTSKIIILSSDYPKLLEVIKDIQLYTKFQTSEKRGRA